MNELITQMRRLKLDAATLLMMLADACIISDECLTLADIAPCDLARAVTFLEAFPGQMSPTGDRVRPSGH